MRKPIDLGNLDDDDYGTIYTFLHSAQSGSDRVGAELHDLLPTFDFLYYKESGDWGLTSTDNKNTTLLDLNADPKALGAHDQGRGGGYGPDGRVL